MSSTDLLKKIFTVSLLIAALALFFFTDNIWVLKVKEVMSKNILLILVLTIIAIWGANKWQK